MSLVSALAVSLLSFSIGAYASIGPVADLHIVNGDIAPDGFSRPAVLAGGTFPGPLITGRKGDNFQINVIDELTDESMLKSTSVHWHGLFQRGSAWADGPAFVTQCPITSGNSFLYDFDVKDQAGTYWYHSHLSTQYCDGLRGPLVVYDPKDPHALLYDVDDESTIITLADWYHTQAKKLKGPAIADATLINGLGRSATGTDSELTVITVQYDKRYRFRLVSMSCDPNYVFSIDQHLMTIIEADGVNSQPLPVDSIQIFAGQRYSFVLHAIQPIGNYWIRANPNSGTKGFDNGINSAILRYLGAPRGEPTTPNVPSTAPLKETDLSPLKSTRVPGKPYRGGADVNKNLLLSFTPEFRFAINNASFIPPTAPVLLQILSGSHTPQDLLPPGSVIPLPPNKVIEISLPITSSLVGFPHPFHLHGHNFHVIRSAGSTEYNFLNPIIRDVVNTGVPGDNVTIRFETDNAGPWFLHCHIDFHLEIGLAIVFAEDVENDSLRSVPESWSELCPKYDALASNDQ